MMPPTRRLTAIALCGLTVAVAAPAVFGAPARPAGRPAQATAAPPASFVAASRVIDKQVIREGEAFGVRAEYDYRFPTAQRRINVILMVENTPGLRGEAGSGGALLTNVKNSLKQFVNAIDYGNGSSGGLTLYAEDYQNRAPLQAGESGRQNLLQAVDLISTKPAGNASGLVSALRDATQRLPERTDDADNILLIINAGAGLQGTGVLLSDLATSCKVAADANIRRVIVNLYGAANGLDGVKDCASPGWVFRSYNAEGQDLLGQGGILDVIADRAISPPKVEQATYTDRISGFLFEYVQGSGRVDGVPSQPNQLAGGDIQWTFTSSPPPGGRVIEYQVKAYDDAGTGKSKLSMQAWLELYLTGNVRQSYPVQNFDMCVYTPLEPDYCRDFALTLTPPVTPGTPTVPASATATSAATDTPTPEATATGTVPPVTTVPPPSQTPTATPTATAQPRGLVLLPVLLRGQVLGAP